MTGARGRTENAVQVVILLATGGMAAAASFTHMHDWTMANAPEGTGDWFGWANAVVADLIPIAAALEVRRQRRAGASIGYPLTVLVSFALLSLAAQVACARPSASGWLLASVPALGFLALTKLVLSRTPAVAPAASVVVDSDVPVGTVVVAPPAVAASYKDVAVTDTPVRTVAAAPVTTATAVAELAAAHPDMSAADIARQLQVSDRTVRRYLADLRTTTPAPVSVAVPAH